VRVQGWRFIVDGPFFLLYNLHWVDDGAKDRTRRESLKPRGRSFGDRGLLARLSMLFRRTPVGQS